MVLICGICCEPYTGPGSDHAIYSTICGHLMGKSCLEKWRNSKAAKAFTCPRCNKKLTKKDYHPIYDLPDDCFDSTDGGELLEKIITDNDMLNDYLEHRTTFHIRFIKRVEQEIGGVTRLIDVHNKYLLLVGYASPTTSEGQFLKIIDCSDGKTLYATNIGNSLCTAVAFNKFKTNVIEFMIGFQDGTLLHSILQLNSPNNIVNIESKETDSIHSICFIESDKCAYSVGLGCLYVTSINGGKSKDNWYRIEASKREIVSNLQKLSDKAVLGIVKGRIYVFEEYEHSYTLCADSGNVVGYTIDHDNSMILVFYSKIDRIGDYCNTTQSYVLRRIMQTHRTLPESKGFLYNAFTRKMVSNRDGKFPTPLSPNLLIKHISGDDVYECSLVPNIKTQTLEVVQFSTTPKVIGKEMFENMEDCLGVNFLNKPDWILKNQLIKLQTAVIFKNSFAIFDIYSPVKSSI